MVFNQLQLWNPFSEEKLVKVGMGAQGPLARCPSATCPWKHPFLQVALAPQHAQECEGDTAGQCQRQGQNLHFLTPARGFHPATTPTTRRTPKCGLLPPYCSAPLCIFVGLSAVFLGLGSFSLFPLWHPVQWAVVDNQVTRSTRIVPGLGCAGGRHLLPQGLWELLWANHCEEPTVT